MIFVIFILLCFYSVDEVVCSQNRMSYHWLGIRKLFRSQEQYNNFAWTRTFISQEYIFLLFWSQTYGWWNETPLQQSTVSFWNEIYLMNKDSIQRGKCEDSEFKRIMKLLLPSELKQTRGGNCWQNTSWNVHTFAAIKTNEHLSKLPK